MQSLQSIFRKNESLITIDIGSSGIKMLEVVHVGKVPTVVNFGYAPFITDVFSGNAITKVEVVGEILSTLIENKGGTDKRVATAVPGPGVFTKKIKVQKVSSKELAGNITLEASNIIPHSIDAVKLDYHIIGESGKNTLDVLVAAVKSEVIESYIESLARAGLETALVDVDHFALHNACELAYPEYKKETVAVINVGARYTSIGISAQGESLFTGDVPVGGKSFTEAIVSGLGVTSEVAEAIKKGRGGDPALALKALEIISSHLESVTQEIARQLTFFWNASGANDAISRVVVFGGGALVPNFIEELEKRVGVTCERGDSLKGFSVSAEMAQDKLRDLKPLLGVCAGMALRQPGDRVRVGG
jgi:type IV pilus assembly protein PilM